MAFLDGAYARLDRAQEHLTDLELRAKAITHPRVKNIIAQTDLNTVKDFVINDPLVELPQIVSVLIGEVIYNLRAALDYLVFDLAAFDSGRPQIGTQFPIDDRPETFASHRDVFLKGISEEHVTRIEKFQPYNGNYYSAMIRDLSNPDKHRKLTVIGTNGIYRVQVVRSSEHHVDPKTGVRTVYKVDMTSDFVGHITFEPDERQAIETLKILVAHVADILNEFKPIFN
jgi:hypothetical protein